METEEEFMVSAAQGVCIAIIFSFIILMIATHNFILSFVAIFCVSIVIISVVAIIVMKGWEYGVSESICTVIIIGLSVDYCVHLAIEFNHSAHRHRKHKMKQSFKNMGVSIFSGMLTTLGCGSFLFGGEITTFEKFALIISSTIVISFLVSMLVFGAIMHICGPMRGCGDIFYSCKEKSEFDDDFDIE